MGVPVGPSRGSPGIPGAVHLAFLPFQPFRKEKLKTLVMIVLNVWPQLSIGTTREGFIFVCTLSGTRKCANKKPYMDDAGLLGVLE
jgi:hypothetical protein